MSVFFIIILLHFGYRCVLQVEGSIDDEIISDVTRLFDQRFYTASTEAEGGFLASPEAVPGTFPHSRPEGPTVTETLHPFR